MTFSLDIPKMSLVNSFSNLSTNMKAMLLREFYESHVKCGRVRVRTQHKLFFLCEAQTKIPIKDETQCSVFSACRFCPAIMILQYTCVILLSIIELSLGQVPSRGGCPKVTTIKEFDLNQVSLFQHKSEIYDFHGNYSPYLANL